VAGPADAQTVSIELDRSALRADLGDRFTFTSILRNDRPDPVSGWRLISTLSN
jgi:hypothetical protein